MLRFVSVIVLSMIATGAFAAAPNTARRSMSSQMVAAPSTARGAFMGTHNTGITSGKQVLDANVGQNAPAVDVPDVPDVPSIDVPDMPGENVKPDLPVQKNQREKERLACMSNNIGVGNTFVWASRFSNLDNYATMIEDVENPENNSCFVKVELKSNDARIDVSDVPTKYYEMGRTITCGAWANADTLRSRILDAKKKARVWGTVGGSVGGAALGVGAMELFGNKLIGGNVQGQEAMEGGELLRSQLLVLKKDDVAAFNKFRDSIQELYKECNSDIWASAEKPAACTDGVILYYDSVKDVF